MKKKEDTNYTEATIGEVIMPRENKLTAFLLIMLMGNTIQQVEHLSCSTADTFHVLHQLLKRN